MMLGVVLMMMMIIMLMIFRYLEEPLAWEVTNSRSVLKSRSAGGNHGIESDDDVPGKECSRKVKVKEVKSGEADEEKEEKVEGETEAVEESVPLQRRIILILFIKSRSRC